MRVFNFGKESKEVKAMFNLLENCVNKNGTRFFEKIIFYDGKKFIATNGKILAIVSSIKFEEFLGIEKGYFELQKNILIEIENNDKYVHYERAVPKENPIIDFCTSEILNSNIKGQAYKDCCIMEHVCIYTGGVFNPSLFKGTSSITWNKLFLPSNKNKPIMLASRVEDYCCNYIVMPLGDRNFLTETELRATYENALKDENTEEKIKYLA